ncbi:FHA domain-containing protein, partial [Nymphaea thermarum]
MSDWESTNMEADSSCSYSPYEEDHFDEDEQYSESPSYGQSSCGYYDERDKDYGEHSLEEQPNEPYKFKYGKVWFEPTKFHSQTSYPSSSHVTGSRRYEKHDQSPRRYHNPHGQTSPTRNETKDLVLSSYKEDIHRRDVTLIQGTELENGPRLRCLLAGRSPKCDLVFCHPNVNDYHFKLVLERDSRKMWVSNETKRGSLQVAGNEIKPRCYMQVYPGEVLKLGDVNRDYKLEWVTPISTQTQLSKSNIKGEHVEARRDVGLCLKENELQRSSNIPSKVPSIEVQGNQPLGDMKCQILQLQ